jgi:hypothetical protein
MLVNSRPELKDKVAPLINELIKGLEITLSDIDEEEELIHRDIKT